MNKIELAIFICLMVVAVLLILNALIHKQIKGSEKWGKFGSDQKKSERD